MDHRQPNGRATSPFGQEEITRSAPETPTGARLVLVDRVELGQLIQLDIDPWTWARVVAVRDCDNTGGCTTQASRCSAVTVATIRHGNPLGVVHYATADDVLVCDELPAGGVR